MPEVHDEKAAAPVNGGGWVKAAHCAAGRLVLLGLLLQETSHGDDPDTIAVLEAALSGPALSFERLGLSECYIVVSFDNGSRIFVHLGTSLNPRASMRAYIILQDTIFCELASKVEEKL